MDTAKEWGIIVFLLLMFGVIFGIIPWWLGKDLGYKRGQIDAAIGKQYYYLQKRDDSTVVWTKRDNLEVEKVTK